MSVLPGYGKKHSKTSIAFEKRYSNPAAPRRVNNSRQVASRIAASNGPSPMNYASILEQIHRDLQPYLGTGKVADYIPELAKVPANSFGMAIVTPSGRRFRIGQADTRFSIQSISKLFACTMAFRLLGDELWQRVGREPSGTPFNSLVQLEAEQGKPRNPFINAGALVVTDVLCRRFVQAETAQVEFIRRLTGERSIGYASGVAAAELQHAHRNRAMAPLMASFC